MTQKIINATLFIFIAIIFTINPSYSGISQGELASYSSSILTKILNENQDSSAKIKQCLNGLLKEGASGMRLVDKLGIFLFDSHHHGMSVEKTRFYYMNNSFTLLMVLKDKKDTQQYTVYLEYDYVPDGGKCVLKDAYFSMVFDEKMKDIKKFFGNR